MTNLCVPLSAGQTNAVVGAKIGIGAASGLLARYVPQRPVPLKYRLSGRELGRNVLKSGSILAS